jgi:RNA polymerase II elongation factor ELL
MFLTPVLQVVKRRIKEEFERTRTDPACQEAFSSFQYLHEKLAHVKRLVHDYDTARVASGGR